MQPSVGSAFTGTSREVNITLGACSSGDASVALKSAAGTIGPRGAAREADTRLIDDAVEVRDSVDCAATGTTTLDVHGVSRAPDKGSDQN